VGQDGERDGWPGIFGRDGLLFFALRFFIGAGIRGLSQRSLAGLYRRLRNNRAETFSHGLAFVFGFSIVFIILGVAASSLGGLLFSMRTWLAKIGGIVVIIFGLHLTGILRIPFLDYDLRPRSKIDQSRSYLSSSLMGVFFSAGWSPCVGPVLGAILTLAFNGGSIAEGVKLLSAYSAGLAVPFLLAALGIGWVAVFLRKYGRVIHYIEIAMGGVDRCRWVVVLGAFALLNQLGFFIDFGL
jgi:cytochrome c-type biogenesis protein